MRISANARRAPLRLTSGAFVINSGVSRFNADELTIKRLHSSAAQLVPQVSRMEPRTFAKVLAAGELTLGTALILPVVPAAVAGLGLSAFAATLLATRQPTGTGPDDLTQPTGSPVPKATEAWMLGSGVSLLLDAVTAPAHDKRVEVTAVLHEKTAAKKRHLRRARRRAAAMEALAAAQLGEKVHTASERLQDAGERAGERIVELRDEYQPVAAKKLKKSRMAARKHAKQLAETARASASDAHERIQRTVS